MQYSNDKLNQMIEGVENYIAENGVPDELIAEAGSEDSKIDKDSTFEEEMKKTSEKNLREAGGVCINRSTPEKFYTELEHWDAKGIDASELARGPWGEIFDFKVLADIKFLAIIHPTAWTSFNDARDSLTTYISELAKIMNQKLHVTQDESTRFYFVTLKKWPYSTRSESSVLANGEWIFVSFS